MDWPKDLPEAPAVLPFVPTPELLAHIFSHLGLPTEPSGYDQYLVDLFNRTPETT